jgi:hypothetical protein
MPKTAPYGEAAVRSLSTGETRVMELIFHGLTNRRAAASRRYLLAPPVGAGLEA